MAIATAVVVAGLGIGLGLAAGQAAHRKGRATMIVLDDRAAGKQVTARAGERIEVVLAETGSTGYRWRVSNGCVEMLSVEADESRPGETTRPGAPGSHRWVFLAKAAGSCELRFESARSWEPAGSGKILRFRILVIEQK